jgi:cell division septal protein FtsQ
MIPREAENRRTSNSRLRKKQQHLLDVKVRTTTERRRRIIRFLSITCKVTLLAAFIAGAWIGGKEALRRFLWENPDYFVRHVEVSTDGTLTREQVLRAGAIVEGSNIFLLNLGRARAGIEKLPQVERAEVTRTLPNRLAVMITERQPIAWLVSQPEEDPTASEGSFLIDARGVVMKNRVKLEEYLNFPTISGIPTENLVPGQRVTLPEMLAAIELIQLTSASTRFQPRHLDLAKGYCMVVTDHKHAKITFALDGVDEQLQRLYRYIARAAQDQREIRTINLIVRNNTPVTFFEPGTGDAAPGADASPDSRTKADLSGPPRVPPAATPAAARASSTPASKNKLTPAPAAPKPAEGVKTKPFRLNP